MSSIDPKSVIIGFLSCALIISLTSSKLSYPDDIKCNSITMLNKNGAEVGKWETFESGCEISLSTENQRYMTNLIQTDRYHGILVHSWGKTKLDIQDGLTGGQLTTYHQNGEVSCRVGQLGPGTGGWVSRDNTGQLLDKSYGN